MRDAYPLVSCIMPTYNRRPFVPHAIEYFLRQDYENKELIVVDDGTDSISDLIPHDDRIRYIRLDKKITLGGKLNLACEYARGDIIAHWDDDDWYAPHRLSYQVQALVPGKIDVCGLSRLLYYDLQSGRAYKYVYPPGQRIWLLGSELCYFKAFWATHRFADIQVGMDTRFVWSADPRRVVPLTDCTFAVHMIHAHNVSPKRPQGACWHPHPERDIEQLLGEDWRFYARALQGTAGLPNGREGNASRRAGDTQAPQGSPSRRAATRVCVGVHVHAEPDRLMDTLRYLRMNTTLPVEILLLPDGPDLATQRQLAELTEFRQAGTEEPRGAPACFNRLVRESDAGVVVFLESGSLVGPDWLDHLLDALDAHPRNGLAGPSTNRAWSLQGAFSHASGTQRDIDATAREAAARYGRRWRSLAPLYCLADFCYVVRWEVVEAVGGADEGYSLGPCWEMDYTIRAVRAGFQAVWAQGAYVYRYPFTARRDRDEKAWFTRNKRRYQDKFCGLRFTRQREGYADHCRGEACPHFAPPSLVQVQLALSTKQDLPPIEDNAGPPPSDLPLVTCIMPTCNRRDWAKQAVSYFLRQDYPHRELVIVDDGQQDLAGELPSDPRIRYLRPTSRLSIGEKRNKGCEVARGQIIAHWDDDDWYAPDRLTRQIEPILSGAADITALFNTCFFDLDRWTFWRCSPEQYRRLFVLDVHGGTLVFRRDVFGRLARYPHHSLAEDAVFLSQAVRRRARLVRVSGADLYLYVRHGANTWTLGTGEAGSNSHWARVSEPLGFASDRGFYEIRFAARRSVHPVIGTAEATA